jgi:hypothetical protein
MISFDVYNSFLKLIRVLDTDISILEIKRTTALWVTLFGSSQERLE